MPTKPAKKSASKIEIPKMEEAETKIKASSKEDKLPSGRYYYANGKRKTSVARVRLYKGTGSIVINDKPIEKFCSVKVHAQVIKFPLKLTGLLDKFNITVRVSGGGPNSQAEAVRHGISRALVTSDETLRHTLKQAGLLTRDPREKERKKPGLHRARRGPQFSKR